MVSKGEKKRLLMKIVDPEHNLRIVQWINWLGLSKAYPEVYRVKRLRGTNDFMLLAKDVSGLWSIQQISEPFNPKPRLRIIKN